ncbi:MAG: hypothetical protein AAF674_13895 [Pseudomonadota bacterium]
MRKLLFAALGALSALIALPVAAEGEFADGSIAKGWEGLLGREPARFEARVVDVICELTGDCPADCGAGGRQMGLVRTADGVLVLAGKNLQSSFNGASWDLYPYCGQTVTVDGLMVGDPDLTATKYYQVHWIEAAGAEAMKANGFTRAWKERNPELADSKGPWFRNDPAVNAAIEKDGWLGLGAEADATYIEENY